MPILLAGLRLKLYSPLPCRVSFLRNHEDAEITVDGKRQAAPCYIMNRGPFTLKNG